MEKVDKPVTAKSVGERDGQKTYVCEMCKKEFKESEGNFVLEKTTFCCKTCCPAGKIAGGSDHEVCEFC